MDNSKKTSAIIILLMLALAFSGYKGYQYRSSLAFVQNNRYHPKQYTGVITDVLDQKYKEVVVIGDSIIYRWNFPNKINGYILINRGIDGETTDDVISRFTKDAVKLKPQYVVILAGINDAATMYEADPNGVDLQIQQTVSNIRLMADIAKGKEITPIVCSVLPVNDKYRLPPQDINNIVIKLNENLESMTKVEGLIYVDFWSIVVDQNTGMLKSDYSNDGIHPSEIAYQDMWNLLATQLK
ncbi:MAG: hypothetical protein CVU90_03505 [Firmicutes bacterium HGW-Firmicutes-15]|nr:MAG: hypothetical protein CVU90_03505 [Firmicutes bacterium HGW-Firmicutes-15]